MGFCPGTWTGFYLGIWMGTGFCPGPIWIMRFCQGIRMGKMWAKLNKASKILSRWAHGWGFARAHGWGFARAHGVLPGHLDTGKTPSMCPSRCPGKAPSMQVPIQMPEQNPIKCPSRCPGKTPSRSPGNARAKPQA